jgi:poly(A) polymerase
MIKKFIRKILGVKSAPEATVAAVSNRKPTVLSAKEHGINPQLVSANAIRVTQTLQDNGFKAFIVGGAVRDLLTGVKPKDFDIATNATPEQVKRLFRRAFIIGRRFQIVHVMFGQDLLEVTTFRVSSNDAAPKDEHGRVLRDNTFGEQHEDAARRDFTINSMYYDPASQTVLDYHGGIKDIRKKILRIIGVPEARYREDPVRMLRVVRFAAKLQFTIDPATQAPIAVMAPLINNVPAARVFDEMLKLLTSGHAMACLQELRKEGLHHGLDACWTWCWNSLWVRNSSRWRWRIPMNAYNRVNAFHQVSCLPRCCGIRCWKNGKPIKQPANFRFRHCIWRQMMC